jgi:hypothetical protein
LTESSSVGSVVLDLAARRVVEMRLSRLPLTITDDVVSWSGDVMHYTLDPHTLTLETGAWPWHCQIQQVF